MSQENVEIVCASLDTWNAGDMDAWEDFLAPDVIWRPPDSSPSRGLSSVGRRPCARLRDPANPGTPTRRNGSA